MNWLDNLEKAQRGELSINQIRELRVKASEWTTCACSELCKDLPRYPKGKPHDLEAGLLGLKFYTEVRRWKWSEAIKTFRRIEVRTAELLTLQTKG